MHIYMILINSNALTSIWYKGWWGLNRPSSSEARTKHDTARWWGKLSMCRAHSVNQNMRLMTKEKQCLLIHLLLLVSYDLFVAIHPKRLSMKKWITFSKIYLWRNSLWPYPHMIWPLQIFALYPKFTAHLRVWISWMIISLVPRY